MRALLCGLGTACWPRLFAAADPGKHKDLVQEPQPTIQHSSLQGAASDSVAWAIGTCDASEQHGGNSSVPSNSSRNSTVPRASAEERDTSCFSSAQASSSFEGQPQPVPSLDASTEGRLIYWQPTPDSPQGLEQQHLWEAPSLELLAAPLEPGEPRPPPPSPPQAELLPEHQRKSFLDASALHLQLSLPRIRAPRSFDAPAPRLALSDGDAHSPRSSGSDGAAADVEQDTGSDGDDADKDGANNGGRTARSCTCSLCCSHGNSSSRVGSSWAATPAAASIRAGGRTPSDIGTPHLPFSRGALEDWSHSQMLTAPLRAAAAAARYGSTEYVPPSAAAPGSVPAQMPPAYDAGPWRGDDIAGSGSGTSNCASSSTQTGPAAVGGEEWLLEDQLTPLRHDVPLRRIKLSPAKSLGGGSSPGSAQQQHHYPHHHRHHHHHHHAHYPSDQSLRSLPAHPLHRRQASWGDARHDAVHTALHDQQPRHASFTAGSSGTRGRSGDGRATGDGRMPAAGAGHAPPLAKASPFALAGGQVAAHTHLAGRPGLLAAGGSEGGAAGGAAAAGGVQRGLGMAGVRYGWDDSGRTVMVSHLQAPPAAVTSPGGDQHE